MAHVRGVAYAIASCIADRAMDDGKTVGEVQIMKWADRLDEAAWDSIIGPAIDECERWLEEEEREA